MSISIRGAVLGAAAVLVLGLGGCTSADDGGTGSDAGGGYGQEPAATEETGEATPSEDAPAAGALGVADSSLGQIVVDGEGMTVYMFDKDTQGGDASACADQCATNWPAVTTDSEMPQVEGVTGEVGTITGVDGSTQVTLNGWPLYTFIGDEAAGDVNGQGVNEVWWVLTPDGTPVKQ